LSRSAATLTCGMRTALNVHSKLGYKSIVTPQYVHLND
jgi:hypothetical protein